MTDYDALYRRLWREVLDREGRIQADAATFVAEFVNAVRAEGWQVGPEAEAQLVSYFDGVESALRAGIGAAIGVGAAHGREFRGQDALLQRDEFIAAQAERAFTERWPDGLNLSQRLWAWKRDMRDGVQRELQAGIRSGVSVNKLVYDMQRAIERAGTRFETVYVQSEDWAADLAGAGRALIHNPEAKAEWAGAVREARRALEGLKESGTRNAAVRAFQEVAKAVHAGREDLVGKALHWWAYDKQLYLLKRIARTEMATAAHQAVIASTEHDEAVIGYEWRLSASHPAPDICDYYAGIDMGLGRGVWTKEAVPRHKAHPHCMCLLIPRVTPRKGKGSTNYAEFVRGMPAEKRAELLPQWARQAMAGGTPLEHLLRPDGMGLVSKSEFDA